VKGGERDRPRAALERIDAVADEAADDVVVAVPGRKAHELVDHLVQLVGIFIRL